MVSFVNFARIASLCVRLRLGTLHGYFFAKTLVKVEFPARMSSKTYHNKVNLCCSLNTYENFKISNYSPFYFECG